MEAASISDGETINYSNSFKIVISDKITKGWI